MGWLHWEKPILRTLFLTMPIYSLHTWVLNGSIFGKWYVVQSLQGNGLWYVMFRVGFHYRPRDRLFRFPAFCLASGCCGHRVRHAMWPSASFGHGRCLLSCLTAGRRGPWSCISVGSAIIPK